MPVWLIQLIVGVVLSLGSTLLEQALSSPPREKAPGYRGTFQSGGKVPLSFVVGTYGMAGKIEYRNSWGQSDGTPSAYLVYVISFGDLPITGMTGLSTNSEDSPVSTTGHVTQGYPVAKYNDGADHLWVDFFDGTQTTVNAYLSGKFGLDTVRPWQGDMIGRGIPYATFTALVSQTLWSGWPTFMAELQGIKLYDPRKDATAGGAGSQRWSDPSTWAFSDNNAVIIYNILRGIYYSTGTTLGTWIWGGHARASQLPYDVWSAAMDACDESVMLVSGDTEKRFRAGREISVDEKPADVITELLVGCNARIAMAAGVYYMLVGAPSSADGSFTDADVLASEGTTLDAFPNLDSIINGATATYLEPGQAWEDKETAPYYRSDLETEDDNRRQTTGLDLKTTFSGTQAQRILKATVEESRRFVRHVVSLTPGFGVYRPLQALSWTSTANGYAGKLFLITAKTTAPNGNVVLGLQEIDPSDHDWSTADEQPLSFAPMSPIRPPAQPMVGFAVSPYEFQDAGATSRRPGILLEYTGALPDIRAVAYEVRENFGAGSTVAAGEITYDTAHSGAGQPIGGQWVIPNTAYQVRAKFLPPDNSGRVTNWSDWLDVTTPDVGFAPPDLGVALAADRAWFQAAINALQNDLSLLASVIQDQDLANYDDKRQVLADITAKYQSSQASIKSVAEVAATANDAAAALATTLGASASGTTADLLIANKVTAGEAGAEVTVGTYLSIDGGTTHTEAFETLEIDATGKSVKTFVCKVLRATNPAGTYLLQFDLENGNSFEGSVA